MRYLQRFHRQLKQIRESLALSRADVAALCNTSDEEVASWEASDVRQRSYPNVAQLLDFCLRTETALDSVIDLTDGGETGQLTLPGFNLEEGNDLTGVLSELEREIDKIRLTDEESEMLRRFRKTSDENRRMIIQLLGS